jgi:hypothetical protein
MRSFSTRTFCVMLLVLAVAASGCGSDNGNGNGNGADADQTEVVEATAVANSEVDCDAVDEAATTFGLGVQILAQLQSQAQYDLVSEGTITFDPDAFDSALTALAPLDSVENPIGSVADSIALYRQANELARENLAVDDPFTEAKGDELAALIDDTGAFIAAQGPVTYAIDEAGC